MNQRFYFLILTAVMALSSQPAYADGYLKQTGAKFGRGIENIVTSPAEIPCRTEIEMKKGDRVLRFFSGLGIGTGYFVRRAVYGVADIITFPIPSKRTLPLVCKEETAGVLL